MGEAELVRRMIAGLRDVAAKCDAMSTRQEPDIAASMSMRSRYDGVPMQTIATETYSRDWISGRLLGMADMAEALLSAVEDPPHDP